MFHFICKSFLYRKNGYFITARNPSILLSSFSGYCSSDENQNSFAVSYMINACGLPLESALAISRRVGLDNPEKHDLVLSFFKNLGFSKAHICRMITRCPKPIFSANPEKTIFPKVEFLRSKGASTTDIIRIFTAYPWLFEKSLQNRLVPCFNFFKGFHQSDEKTIKAITRYPRLLDSSPENYLIPNVNVLREYGVPASNISYLACHHPLRIGFEPGKFKKIVEEVKEMGFDPLKSNFVFSIIVLLGITKAVWDKKVNAYNRWGWSHEDVYKAFRKCAWCMSISEGKILAMMNFYVNKMGLDSSVFVHRPVLLGLSLKKRLVPRASVIQFLSSKGLIKTESDIIRAFECTEKHFIEKFINCHEEAPHMLKLYNEKLDPLKQMSEEQQRKGSSW